jgi:hypothetical protein
MAQIFLCHMVLAGIVCCSALDLWAQVPLAEKYVEEISIEHAQKCRWSYVTFDDKGLAYEESLNGDDKRLRFNLFNHQVFVNLEGPSSKNSILLFTYSGTWKLARRIGGLVWDITEPVTSYHAQGGYQSADFRTLVGEAGEGVAIELPNLPGSVRLVSYKVRFPGPPADSKKTMDIGALGSFPMRKFTFVTESAGYVLFLVDLGSQHTKEQLLKEVCKKPEGCDASRDVSAISAFPGGWAFHIVDKAKGAQAMYVYLDFDQVADFDGVPGPAALYVLDVVADRPDYQFGNQDYQFLGSLFKENGNPFPRICSSEHAPHGVCNITFPGCACKSSWQTR